MHIMDFIPAGTDCFSGVGYYACSGTVDARTIVFQPATNSVQPLGLQREDLTLWSRADVEEQVGPDASRTDQYVH